VVHPVVTRTTTPVPVQDPTTTLFMKIMEQPPNTRITLCHTTTHPAAAQAPTTTLTTMTAVSSPIIIHLTLTVATMDHTTTM